ncbi:uncharacterized protein LOC142579922 [Dermacentor variabilis]|uniref:uncharacterized protein LOC142579922 n=1 Tax=Dermacentor variabilis TaxID=34621 RepID=UPI003F5B0963
MAYEDCYMQLIVNKCLSSRVPLRSSVRQGCPLSPLLFALYLEPFCMAVIRNENIRGFRLHAAEVKMLAYADDVAVFCEDRESVVEAVRLARSFCRYTGAQINFEKSVGIWHGSWDATPTKFAGMQWTTVPPLYLGVPLEHYRDSTQLWTGQIESMKEKIKGWQGRGLSVFARASACNIFLIAKVWYILQVMFMSRVNVQKMHRVFATFIWNSTWERSSRTNLFRTVRNGGLGLSHLFIRQIVSRFIFLRDERNVLLRTVIQAKMATELPEFVVSTSSAITRATGYYREVVASFRILCARFSLEYLCSVRRKKLYADLVDSMLPIPLYRSVYCGDPGKDVLKRVKRMPVRPAAKTFFFHLHTNTLPVKVWLEQKGIFVPWTTDCRLCKKPETIEHAFIECWDAVFHWDILQRTLKKELPINPYGIRFLPVESDDGPPFDMFMLLGLHSLWKTRMAVRHADVNVCSARENFIESMSLLREVYRAQSETPDWVSILDELVCLKKF